MAEKIKRVYFYCAPMGSPKKAAFQHTIISIAEGLKELGVEFYADKNYWKLFPTSDEYLFNFNPNITPNDCDVVALNDVWFSYGQELPKDVFNPNRKYTTVYIVHVDYNDGLYNSYLREKFKKCDIVLRCHYNRKLKYAPNVKPWAFGLTNRIIDTTRDSLSFSKRKKSILVNYRVSQQVRKLANEKFIPKVSQFFKVDATTDEFNTKPQDSYGKMMWEQTGRRHYPAYYKKLKNSAASACFGGMFVFPYPSDTNNIIYKLVNFWNLHTVKYAVKTDTITQFDGWRFWETLASGCVAIHVDLKKYGIQFPVMPENFKHYIGVDFDNIEQTYKKIKDNLNLLPLISAEGKKWALENYGPNAVAKRFIRYILDYKKQTRS